jgi:hypothetical protein
MALAALIVLIAASAVRADDQGEARKIVDKAIVAMGGEANLAKYKAMTFKGKGTFYGMGQGLPYTGDWAAEPPHRFRMSIEGAFILVLNGDKGWVSAGGATSEMTKEQLEATKEDNYAHWVTLLTPLKDKGFSLSAIGEEKIENRPAVGVKVTHKGHRDINIYFDKETNLLVKVSRRATPADQGGKEVLVEQFLSDYKEVNGVKVAAKMVDKRDGQPYVDGEIFDVKLAEKLDDKVFDKP